MLQIKEIPPRPERFDGALCLFGLATGVDADVIREKLGEGVHCQLDQPYPWVQYPSHDAALKAKQAWPPGLSQAVDTRYKDRPYDERGW